jgi:hypothetical protein
MIDCDTHERELEEQAEAIIGDMNRKFLSSLLMIELLGGTLQDAISQTRAAMLPEDVELVLKEIERRKKERANSN